MAEASVQPFPARPPIAPFAERVAAEGVALTRDRIETLQINVGKLCNQTCHHCHVDAGPKRTEIMTRDTIAQILTWLAPTAISIVDITGGAPELNPHFRYLVESLRAQERHVIVRCNLTVLLEPGQEDTAEFFRDMHVEVISSLPCYLEHNVDAQRGGGVFAKSILALRRLNALGFGMPGSELELHLVYNPLGPNLPPAQEELADAYHRELKNTYDVHFHRLLTLANMPIARFAGDLRRLGAHDKYMHLLAEHFNAATLPGVMCRSLISVGWDGQIYDCDFNQMLEIPAGDSVGNGPSLPRYLWDVEPAELIGAPVQTGDHCYGCTAGTGSSCTGALA